MTAPKNLHKKNSNQKKEVIKQNPSPSFPPKNRYCKNKNTNPLYAYVALYLTPPPPSRVSRNAVRRRRPHLCTTGITVIPPLGTVSATTSQYDPQTTSSSPSNRRLHTPRNSLKRRPPPHIIHINSAIHHLRLRLRHHLPRLGLSTRSTGVRDSCKTLPRRHRRQRRRTHRSCPYRPCPHRPSPRRPASAKSRIATLAAVIR